VAPAPVEEEPLEDPDPDADKFPDTRK